MNKLNKNINQETATTQTAKGGQVEPLVMPQGTKVFDNRKLFDKERVDKCAKSIEWETPPEVFEPLDTEFNFTLDVCATEGNAKCEHYFTKEQDGLSQFWSGMCWMNPPFGRSVKSWIGKAKEEAEAGRATTVCLIPAKTNTNWWHEMIIDKAEVRFIRGRIKFIKDGKQATQALPWPMAIVVFRALTV